MADKIYKELIVDCITQEPTNNRTDIPARCCFGRSVKIDCSNNRLAMITLKKVHPKNVLIELLWMLRGSTNVNELIDQGCNIWNGNSTKEFLEKRGLNYQNRVIGPGYGFQWRSSGGSYDESGKRCYSGVDQIKNVINQLLHDPSSRRIILNSWIPEVLDLMALPPCHMMMQFNVDGKYLDMQVYQRSADIFLGVPYNFTSYSIMLCLFAQLCGYKPRNLAFAYGNYHIYENHVEQCKEVMGRHTKNYGTLTFSDKILNTPKKLGAIMEVINELHQDDFVISDYESHPFLKGVMAI